MMKGKLVVWYPTKEFLDFIVERDYDFQIYERQVSNYWKQVDEVSISNYERGAYDGIVGLAALFDNEPLQQESKAWSSTPIWPWRGL